LEIEVADIVGRPNKEMAAELCADATRFATAR
jgi:hypothetical protein